ncbi:MAG: hypothetical protein ACKO4T_05095 [Planctomycetaceae bacterium]
MPTAAFRRLMVALAILQIAGCGGQGFTSADVTGTVKIDGKPAAGLMVQFEPKDGEGTKLPPGTGMTNAEGGFVLLRPGGKSGAVVGTNTVRVLNGEGGEMVRIGGRQIEGAVSQREVKPGPNVIDIELKLK